MKNHNMNQQLQIQFYREKMDCFSIFYTKNLQFFVILGFIVLGEMKKNLILCQYMVFQKNYTSILILLDYNPFPL